MLSDLKKIISLVIYFFIVYIAFLFHQSAIFFALVPLMLLKFNTKIQYAIAIGSLVVLFVAELFPVKQYIVAVIDVFDLNRFDYIVNRDLINNRFGVRSLLYSFISIYIVFIGSRIKDSDEKRTAIRSFFVNLYIVATLINSFVWDIPAATRLPMNWLFFEFAVIFLVTNACPMFNRQTKSTIYVVYTIVSFALLLHSFPLVLNY